MVSRRMQSSIGWMTGLALACAAPVFAQTTPGSQPGSSPGEPRAPQSAPAPTTPGGGSATPQPMGTGTAGDQGATAGANGSSSTGKASMGDKHFVKEQTEGGNAEIALGKMVQEKSNSADVKQFGDTLVKDHTNLNEQMAPVAQQMGVSTSPDQLSPKDKALEKKLQGLSGDQFDKAFIQSQVKDHEQDVKKFKHEIATTKDPMLKQTAEQGLPVIQKHLQIAEQLAQAHNVNTGGAQASSTSTQ